MLVFDLSMPKEIIPVGGKRIAPNATPSVSRARYHPYRNLIDEISKYLKLLQVAEKICDQLNLNNSFTSFSYTADEIKQQHIEIFNQDLIPNDVSLDKLLSILEEMSILIVNNIDGKLRYTPVVDYSRQVIYRARLSRQIERTKRYHNELRNDEFQRIAPLTHVPLGWTASGNVRRESATDFMLDGGLQEIQRQRIKHVFAVSVVDLLTQVRQINDQWVVGTYKAHFWSEFGADIFMKNGSDPTQFLHTLNEVCWQNGAVDKMFAWAATYGDDRVVKNIRQAYERERINDDPSGQHNDHIHLFIRPVQLTVEVDL